MKALVRRDSGRQSGAASAKVTHRLVESTRLARAFLRGTLTAKTYAEGLARRYPVAARQREGVKSPLVADADAAIPAERLLEPGEIIAPGGFSEGEDLADARSGWFVVLTAGRRPRGFTDRVWKRSAAV
jgi:hypothetical protein